MHEYFEAKAVCVDMKHTMEALKRQSQMATALVRLDIAENSGSSSSKGTKRKVPSTICV